LRAFRLSNQYIKIDGLRFSGYQNMSNGALWGAAVRVDNSANYCTITNCLWTGYPYVLAHDFRFDAAQNRIISDSSDFAAAGFRVGGKVYLGASGATYGGTVVDDVVIGGTPLFFANHDTAWTVAEVGQTYLGLSGASMVADDGTDYWSFVRAGTSHGGNPAITFITASNIGAIGVTISNNTIKDWPAHAIELKGDNHIVEDNTIEDLKSFRFIQFTGSNHIIRRNIFRKCPNILHYSQADMATLVHPAGTGWYDYQVGMFSGITTQAAGGTHNNVLVDGNWFEDIENQLGRIDSMGVGWSGEANNITYSNNVFVGAVSQFSGGRPGMRWVNNTFYRCAIGANDGGAAHPLTLGARETDVPQTGYELTNNVFVSCGPMGIPTTETRGFYSIADWVVTPIKDYNFVTSDEVTGFLAKSNFSEANGITGGDPLFVNPDDPDGPDDIPFTNDDGLKVLPTSPVATLNAGALGVKQVAVGQPMAHFKITAPTGWFEALNEAYDPTWLSKLPTQRSVGQRPYNNPVSIGTVPVAATFSAATSISGVAGATTPAAITSYAWNFGDGGTGTGQTPSHTFTSGGDFTVRLTVTNSDGNTNSYSRIYRVTGTVTGQVAPSAPTGLRLR
jgi:hypothetical protein